METTLRKRGPAILCEMLAMPGAGVIVAAAAPIIGHGLLRGWSR